MNSPTDKNTKELSGVVVSASPVFNIVATALLGLICATGLLVGCGSEEPIVVQDVSDWSIDDPKDNDQEAELEGPGWRTVSLGGSHTCGIAIEKSLWCWGGSGSGKLGISDATGPRYTPTKVDDTSEWSVISAAAQHTCGVRKDGSLWCWGGTDELRNRGQLGLGDTDGRTVPTRVGTSDNWEMVASGNRHTCGLQSDGTLWCWGAGTSGRLGSGDTADIHAPHQVGSGQDWQFVYTSRSGSWALRENNSLWGFGGGPLGEEDPDRSVPNQVGTDTDWQFISMRSNHICGIREDGTLWCWGRGNEGQLGLGDEPVPGGSTLDDPYHRKTPKQVGDDTDWVSVAAGRYFTCGVRGDGTLWCWGSNRDSRLGLGIYDDIRGLPEYFSTPQKVGDDTDWRSVSAGVNHACAIRDDHSLWCWGTTGSGKLGIGDPEGFEMRASPMRVDHPYE